MHNSDPIFSVMDRWFQHLRGELEGGLDALLHEDCVFLSPVVYTPQRGREITKRYLTAAGTVLPGEPTDDSAPSAGSSAGFGYTKHVVQGTHAVLEFETTVDGMYVNGVDIITCDDDGWITEFKVMMRPYKALEVVRDQMMATMEKLSAD
ncbi:MAG: nuclear transport factor 2 family protein [Acidimicrobiales bacterium]